MGDGGGFASACYIPSNAERLRVSAAVERAVELAKRVLAERGVEFSDVVAGGSTAKDTFLPGDADIDVFIVTRRVDEAFNALKSRVPGRRKVGELKIWSSEVDGFDVDFVVVNPELTRRWFTLEHTKIYSQLTERQKSAVRRLKALMKEWCAYGAENGGITGVAIEELVRRYGSDLDACRRIVKSEKPFWLQDPAAERAGVKRNLLASISPEKWRLIREACIALLSGYEPRCEKCDVDKFIDMYSRRGWMHVKLPSTGQKYKDYTKARSSCLKACRELKSLEPEVTCECDAYSDGRQVAVAFKVEPTELSETKLVCLPETAKREDVEAFKEAHPNWFISDDGRVCAEVKRKVKSPLKFLVEKIRERAKSLLGAVARAICVSGNAVGLEQAQEDS